RVTDMQVDSSDQTVGRPQPRPAGNTKENIFLFIPNLIGYARIILAVVSLYFMPIHPRRCSAIYATSCLLDALDGYAARKLDQGTKFGAVLDMVTDRCTTTCMLVFLATAMPRWAMLFQLLISLDLASHYVHMYATLSMGGSEQSHKKIVLFTLCLMNELFFIALYLLTFADQDTSLVESQMRAIVQSQPWSAGAMEVARANKIQSSVPTVLVWLSLFPMLIKQWINVQQLIIACQWLAEGDAAERARRD
ncbi:unnamed protein product, partial [Aureobasidium vineae]